MFVPDVPFALWSMRTAPDSNYKGVYLQKLRNDLVKTADANWKWHHFQGVLQRSDNANVFGSDPDKIAKGLIGPKATKADLESVERILAAIKLHRQDIEPQVRDTYRSTLAPKKPGEKPDPNAPQIDEATKPKVGREFQHLEDLVYMHGVDGVKDIVRRLQQIAKSTQELEVKWDGCVDGNLILETNVGKITMNEVIDRHQSGEHIQVMAHDLDISKDKMVDVELSTRREGSKKWIEVELENGDVIRLTEDHELFTTNRGWVEARDLTEDDDIKELGREKM
jgi:hypothetical protein